MTPDPASIRAARTSAGHTLAVASSTVMVELRSWQRWEAGDRAMPAGLWALYLLLTDQHPDLRAPKRRGRAVA